MIHFIRPWWALAFIVLVFVFFILKKIRNEKTGWEKICDPDLLEAILIKFPTKKKSIFFPIVLCSLVILSLMGPAFQKLPQPIYHKGQDVLFALDVSLASSLTDITPSRLTKSLFKLHDLSEKLTGVQMGLVLYADTAFTAIPLTPDKSLLQTLLPTVQSGIMGEGVASISTAINQSVELLTQAQSSGGNILIFASSNDESAIETAKKAFEKGFKVSVVAVGTKENTPLLKKNGKFLTKNGKTVLSALDEKNLMEIATVGGGIFVSITEDETDLNKISAYIVNEKINSHELADNDLKADIWQDLGVYIILILLPFIALFFRKGILFSLILFCTPAKANFLVNPEYTEAQNIQQGQNPTNPEIFKKNDWKSVAWYRWNNYQKVIELLKDETNPENIYNLGNALAQSGQLKEAIEAYDRVLSITPNHEDAIFNKKLVEDLLKEQEKNQQNQNQKNDQNKQDKKDKQDQKNQDNQSDKNDNQNNENKENNDKQDSQNQDQQNQSQQNQSNADSKSDSSNNDEQSQQQQNQSSAQPEEQQDGKNQAQQQGLEPDEDKSNENRQEVNSASSEKTDDPLDDEQKKWLNLVPDDPSALLRARIRYHNIKTNRR
ncbi:MAG: VWA domain-containing protein [Alphaproteobacteria bacterium]|nr:VWA domain-containing protein [Alphaproteobacteria bacterium]